MKVKKTDIVRFSFKELGIAMREARQNEGWSQEEVAEKIGITQKYYQRLETNADNQHPGLQIFYDLVHLFHLSVDEFFFSNQRNAVSSKRRRLDSLLDQMDELELTTMESNATALLRLRHEREKALQITPKK